MSGYYKEENDQLIQAPHNIGNVCNADRDAVIMTANGYSWYSDEEKAAWDADHPLAVPAQSVFSKLAIRRAMRHIGLEEKLDWVLANREVSHATGRTHRKLILPPPFCRKVWSLQG